MNEYKLRIANKAPKNKHNCYPFSNDSIINIPKIDLFLEDRINEKIRLGCQDVLKRSMSYSNNYRYGEMGLLISILDNSIYERFSGTYECVPINGTSYKEIVTNRNSSDLVFIHNHPNDSILSYADLYNLIHDKSMYGVIAIVNRHNIHIVFKENESLALRLDRYVAIESNKLLNMDPDKKIIKYYNDIVCANILKTSPEVFGLEYIHIRRKQIWVDISIPNQ